MNPRFTEPPAIVQGTETLATIARMICADHAANDKDARATVLRCKRIGEWLLEAKGRCEHGQWLEWCKKHLPFNHQQAAYYMRKAKDFSKLLAPSNLTEIFRCLADDGEESPQPGDAPPPAANEPQTPQIANLPLCARCTRSVRVGQAPDRGCLECKAVRKKAGLPLTQPVVTAAPIAPPVPKPAPKPQSTNGKVVPPLKEYLSHLGQTIRDLDALGKLTGRKESPERYQFQQKVKDLMDEFKTLYHDWTRNP